MAHLEKITRKRLGEMLVAEGLVTTDHIQEALQRQKQTGELLGEILSTGGYVTESDIAKTLCTQFQKPYIDATKYNISKDVVALLPPQMLIEHLFIPLDRFDDILIVCMAGLLTDAVISALVEQTGCEVEIFIGTMTQVKQALRAHFPDYFDPITLEPQFDQTISSAAMQRDFEQTEMMVGEGFSNTRELQDLVEEDYDWEALFEEAEKEVMKELQNRKQQ